MLKYTPFINIIELVLSFIKKFSLDSFSSSTRLNSGTKDVVQFISRSSWFILLVALIKQDKIKTKLNIWLPSYYCDDPIYLLNKLDIEINFYDVDDNFEVISDSIKLIEKENNSPDIIVMCNFIGKNFSDKEQLYFYQLKKKYEAWLIQDATHCIDFNDVDCKYSDFTCLSPYKFFSLPYGALYYSNSKFLDKNEISFLKNEKLTIEYLEKKLEKINFKKNNNIKLFIFWLLKSLITFFYPKIKIKEFNDDYYLENINLFPHPKTNYILKNYIFFKYKKIEILKFRIKQSALKWKKTLLKLNFKNIDKIKIDEININSTSTPYFLKINSAPDTIFEFYNYLKNKKIPVLTWPNLSKNIKQNAIKYNANNLRKSIIYVSLNYQVLLLNKKINKLFSKQIEESNINNTYELVEINKAEKWNEYFVKIERNNILQDWNYGNALSLTKRISIKRYLIKGNHEKKCIFQVLSYKKSLLNVNYINRGPLYFNNISNEEKLEITSYLIDKFDKLSRFKLFKIIPDLQINSENIFIKKNKNLTFFKEPNWSSSIINLNDDLINIKSRFRGSIKNDINFFEKKNDELIVNEYDSYYCPLPEENKKIMQEMYLKDQKEKNFQGINLKLLNEILKQSNYKLYEICNKENGKIVAYGLFYLHYPSATYLLGTFNNEFKKYRSMTNILFLAIKDLKKNKYKYFDLGGIDYFKNKNVAYFKKKFNGQEYTLVGIKKFV